MDPLTAKLAAELQLAEIDELLDDPPDNDALEGDVRAGLQIMRCDLQQMLRSLEGQVLTLRNLGQNSEHRVDISRLLNENDQTAPEHSIATRLQDLTISDSDSMRSNQSETDSFTDASDFDDHVPWEIVQESDEDALESEIRDLSLLEDSSKEETVDGVVEGNPSKKILSSDALIECCAWMETVPSKNILTLKCEPQAHEYCRKCLINIFASAIDDTTLFPPRCCKLPIPLDECHALLPKELVKKFDLKVEELATPNPTYCSNVECSRFIRSQEIKADIGTCVFCAEMTCVRCKCKSHEGLCPSDPHVQLLLDAAKSSRWQKCTKCKNLIELAHGCLHMT
jgi:E3 ubiquitin-protein ligase RNF144